ncbi:MAG: hypothetical protein ACTJG2_01275 [Candidatus Saccharimonadales bacterium]
MSILSQFNPSALAKKQLSRAFKEYSRAAKAAYLGEISAHSVNQHLVRGFTTSNTHKDTNHSVGQFLHHDYIMLSREDGKQRYIITEVDLHALHPYDHFFILPNDLTEALFTEVLKRHVHHRHTPFSPDDGYLPAFKQRYSIFTRPEHFTQSLRYVTPEVAKCIAEVKQSYLFEVHDTSLFVYDYSNQPVTEKTLAMQMRFACTIATLLETQNRK